MSTQKENIQDILDRYLAGTCTPQQQQQVDQWLEQQQIKDDKWAQMDAQQKNTWINALYAQIQNTIADGDRTKERNMLVHRVHFLRTAWFRYAAAVILLIGTGGYLLWSDRGEIPARGRTDKGSVVQTKPLNNNKAILTLADGSQILLDNNNNGTIAQQDNAQIIKLSNGQLAYQLKGEAGKNTLLNTMSTPRGSQYQLILPDGSKVWLNAASSITYPANFTSAKREVSITGEAYFEIATNKKQPFTVKAKGMQVQVLGTNFNVSAYEDVNIKTSLLEGSVKVNDQLLTPGQAYANGEVIRTDLEQDIAWKKGIFNFNHLPLKDAMSQLANWYDLDIVYEGRLPQFAFSGEMGRDLSLDEMLAVLSGLEERIDLKLEGRKLTVSAR